MKIIPIACTNINWELFVKECNDSIGRSPTRSLDKNNLPAGSIDSYFSALNEFLIKDSNPREINESVLDHVSLTFLMTLDNGLYYSLLENCFKSMHIIKSESSNSFKITTIVTGTIWDWKYAIINGPLEWSKVMWDIFHKINFGRIFKDYKINNFNQIERR